MGSRIEAWLSWFGPARLVTSAVAVLIVCAGGWWLVRSPPPPTEAALPMATTTPVGTRAAEPVLAPASPASSGTAPVDAAADVVVHVAGAVERPGVYELPVGSRVDHAIERAGGASPTADTGALNLAAVVPDGARVVVPEQGESLPSGAELGLDTAGVDGVPSSAGSGTTAVVDVNRAAAFELETLPGVGPATAAAIIEERERNGPFATVADLERVPGIGPVRLAAISELVTT